MEQKFRFNVRVYSVKQRENIAYKQGTGGMRD